MKHNSNSKRKLLPYIFMAIIATLMVLINIVARLSPTFSDFYLDNIFPLISFPLMLFSGIFSFSVGECLIAFWVIGGISGAALLIVFACNKKNHPKAFKKFSGFFMKLVLWMLVFALSTETLNCFVMYQCTPFPEKYFDETAHTEELLLDTLDDVATAASELCNTFDRDADGYIILDGDLSDECIAAMNNISCEYSQLSGLYPKPKKIVSSFFMSQQGMIGLFIPFTMEATYNRDIQPIAAPATLCHELAHLKGIIQEDEANFVSMVACFNSDCDAVKYSGYLDALYYLYSDAKKLKGTDYEERLYRILSVIPSIVWTNDISSFTADYWEKNSHKEIIPTETVQAVSETLTDASLQFNGVSDGIMSYYRVVELLMDYKAAGNTI